MSEPNEKKTETPIVERLIDSLLQFYEPADSPSTADETKSTQELIEEMDQMQDGIMTWEVNKLMELHGFKMHYTGSGYVWLLKIKELRNERMKSSI